MANHDEVLNKRPSVTKDVDNINQSVHSDCDVLIIGAGLAGLSTALSLPSHLQVTVLAKEDVLACSSNYAQGGIAAVIDPQDNVDEHVNDTLIAGDGLCDPVATTYILEHGGQAIHWLLQHNVPFTTHGQSKTDTANNAQNTDNTSNKRLKDLEIKTSTQHNLGQATLQDILNAADLHLTQEGGHGCRRVAHADDATGKHIMQSLLSDVAQAANITLLPFHQALQLLTSTSTSTSPANNTHARLNKKYAKGAIVFDSSTQTLITFHAKAIVLASGGLGQLFGRATAPSVCVGDGIMMAWEAGCRLANLEFIQFHPTGLAIADTARQVDNPPERNFLISEALRGEGAHLLDPITGTRFMPAYDERKELAPRDIVARAIASEIEKNGLGYVHLDISYQPSDFIKSHFPDIYAHCLSKGIDITIDPIPVAPTAHYTCGGVVTTATGQTDVKGLYAAGEVAHTGLHGANRLASNSLLECVVVGRAVAQHIPTYLTDNDNWTTYTALSHSVDADSTHTGDNHVSSDEFIKPLLSQTIAYQAITETNGACTALMTNDLTSSLFIRPVTTQPLQQLKQLMTDAMGIRRTQSKLSAALSQVEKWQQQALSAEDEPMSTLLDTISHFNWQRLLTLATLMLLSAQVRIESRGGHYRDDYPHSSENVALSIIKPLSNGSASLVDTIHMSNVHEDISKSAPTTTLNAYEIAVAS